MEAPEAIDLDDVADLYALEPRRTNVRTGYWNPPGAAENLPYNLAMATRGYGTGQLYEKHGSYYGRRWTLDGRRVNRLIGPIRPPVKGLTRPEDLPG